MKKILIIILISLITLPLLSCKSDRTKENVMRSSIVLKNRTNTKENKTTTKKEDVKELINSFDMFDESHIKLFGRIPTEEYKNEKVYSIRNAASGFEVSFKGSKLSITIATSYNLGNIGEPVLRVYIDGESKLINIPYNEEFYTFDVAQDLDADLIHTVRVLKAIEEDFSIIYLKDVDANEFYTPNSYDLRFDFYGDSITCGYGILGNGTETALTTSICDATETYAVKISDYFGADFSVVAKQGIALSLDTDANKVGFTLCDVYDKYSIYSEKTWDFSKEDPDFIFINIGTNDYSNLFNIQTQKYLGSDKEKSNLKSFLKNYKELIESLHEKSSNAKIILLYGMMGGQELYKDIENMVNGLGYKYLYSINLSTLKAGGLGHPSVSSNYYNSETIIEFLSKKFDLNK